MKSYKSKTLADTASAVGSMLLFLLFAVCMLLAVSVAADTYTRIKSGYQQSFGAVSSIKYISNKLRSGDEVTLLENGKAAAISSDGMTSVIYCRNGELYEKNTLSEDYSAQGGDVISKVDEMTITEHDGIYEITVSLAGEKSSVLVRRG